MSFFDCGEHGIKFVLDVRLLLSLFLPVRMERNDEVRVTGRVVDVTRLSVRAVVGGFGGCAESGGGGRGGGLGGVGIRDSRQGESSGEGPSRWVGGGGGFERAGGGAAGRADAVLHVC